MFIIYVMLPAVSVFDVGGEGAYFATYMCCGGW